MNIIRGGAVQVVGTLERLQQLHISEREVSMVITSRPARRSNPHVVELAVTHVGVDLGFILRHRRVDAEGFTPGE